MIALVEFIAVLSCTLFAGAAIYVNLVEHPARMGCDTKTAATVWAPSYQRGTVMQASLAIASMAAGITVWLLGGGATWLVSAIRIGLGVPFTLVLLNPPNNQLPPQG